MVYVISYINTVLLDQRHHGRVKTNHYTSTSISRDAVTPAAAAVGWLAGSGVKTASRHCALTAHGSQSCLTRQNSGAILELFIDAKQNRNMSI